MQQYVNTIELSIKVAYVSNQRRKLLTRMFSTTTTHQSRWNASDSSQALHRSTRAQQGTLEQQAATTTKRDATQATWCLADTEPVVAPELQHHVIIKSCIGTDATRAPWWPPDNFTSSTRSRSLSHSHPWPLVSLSVSFVVFAAIMAASVSPSSCAWDKRETKAAAEVPSLSSNERQHLYITKIFRHTKLKILT